jgi:hypothetical protein
MLYPDQFQVNEVWIALRVNDSFTYVQGEPYDIYVLVDAASCYVMGHVLSKTVDEAPNESDVETLFKEAWGAKRQWPKKLIVPENDLAEITFSGQAEKNGFLFETVPLSDLGPIVGELKELFASDFR